MRRVNLLGSTTNDLDRLPRRELKRVIEKIESLGEDATPRGYRKLRGFKGLYRIRIGSYRVIYSFNEKEVEILRVRHRKNVYDGLK